MIHKGLQHPHPEEEVRAAGRVIDEMIESLEEESENLEFVQNPDLD
ncbi:MAG: hypothetical protein RTV31_00590 [Candidatus Thorarchaeota archaeon]